VVMGSVHYASPEQLRSSKDADIRSDIWSVGVILFRMITGELPFRGNELADIIVKVCAEPVPKPSSIVPGLHPSIDALLEMALNRNPVARFQTIADLVDAFASVAKHAGSVSLARGQTIEAIPLSPREEGAVGRTAAGIALPGQEDKTAVWAPPRGLEPPSSAVLPDTTLRGAGVLSTMSAPLESTSRRGRLRAIVAIALLALVAGGATTVRYFMSGGSPEVSSSTPLATSPAVAPANRLAEGSSSASGLAVAGVPPAPSTGVITTSSVLSTPGVPSASVTATPPAETALHPLPRDPNVRPVTLGGKALPTPATKPTAPTSDNDVEMP